MTASFCFSTFLSRSSWISRSVWSSPAVLRSARERYEYENQPVPPMPSPLTYEERKLLRNYARAYTMNYMYRCAAPYPLLPLCLLSLSVPLAG